jgi:UTP-glucose-1-phosphate uridylyltransferase
MRALTGGAPKELLEVAGEPLLVHALRECGAAGIDNVLVVIAPGKEAIVERAAPLAGAPGAPRRIDFATQEEPRGLADAIRLGRAFAGRGPLAVVLPDNLFVGGAPAVAQVAESYGAAGVNVVGIVSVRAEEAARRGATPAYAGRPDGDLFRLTRIPEKGAPEATFDTGERGAAFTGIGRYVFAPDVFPAIDAVERTLQPGAELDDVPVLRRLLAGGRLVGRLIQGRFLDAGNPAGYREARAVLGPVARGSAAGDAEP